MFDVAIGDAEPTLQFHPRSTRVLVFESAALAGVGGPHERKDELEAEAPSSIRNGSVRTTSTTTTASMRTGSFADIRQQLLLRSRRNWGWIAGFVLGSATVVLLSAVVVRAVIPKLGKAPHGTAAIAVAGVAAKPSAAAEEPATAVAPNTAIPGDRASGDRASGDRVMSVDDLPRPLGMLRGTSRGERVLVDGVFVTVPAQVTCGMHEITIGMFGQAQHVNVPCGGSVVVR